MSKSTEAVVLTECPKGHERSVTVQEGTPLISWTLVCPLCGEEHQEVLPQILAADPA